jgi:hypothetical protein
MKQHTPIIFLQETHLWCYLRHNLLPSYHPTSERTEGLLISFIHKSINSVKILVHTSYSWWNSNISSIKSLFNPLVTGRFSVHGTLFWALEDDDRLDHLDGTVPSRTSCHAECHFNWLACLGSCRHSVASAIELTLCSTILGVLSVALIWRLWRKGYFLIEFFLQTCVFQEDSIPNQAIKSIVWSRFTFSWGLFSAGMLTFK